MMPSQTPGKESSGGDAESVLPDSASLGDDLHMNSKILVSFIFYLPFSKLHLIIVYLNLRFLCVLELQFPNFTFDLFCKSCECLVDLSVSEGTFSLTLFHTEIVTLLTKSLLHLNLLTKINLK